MIGCRTALDSTCRDLAEKLGRAVARKPSSFILLPLCAVCAALFPFVNGFVSALGSRSGAGAIQLFTPEYSECAVVRSHMQSLFPDGGYFTDRTLLAPNLLIVVVEAKDGSNVLQPTIVAEYERLRLMLEGIVVELDGDSHSYRSMCLNVAFSTHCRPDAFLTLVELWNRTWIPNFTYPLLNITIGPLRRSQNIGPLLGGVELNEKGEIGYVRFVRLIFNLPPTISASVLDKYERAWTDNVTAFASSIIQVQSWSSRQYDRDMRQIGVRTMRLVPLLLVVIVVFSVGSSVMRDPVLSKPLLAFSGVVSAGLGIVTAHGLLFIAGVPLIQIAMITPYLVLSIGIDDMFVMINVWRKTNPRLSVEERMARTYRESAVSILLTTLTDAVAFMVGAWSPFPAVRIFCIHCCVSIAIVFIFQVTLFGAFLGLAGRREAARRHCLTMKVVQENKKQSSLHMVPPQPCAVIFFKDCVTPLFDHSIVQLAIFGSYILYVIGTVVLLATKVEQGLELSSLLPYDTSTFAYLKTYERYFGKFGTSLEVVIDDQIDYTDYGTQMAVMEAVAVLENTPYTLTADFWLRDFLHLSDDRSAVPPAEFHAQLSSGFLKNALYSHYAADLVMLRAPSGDLYINASRFYIGLRNVDRNSRSSAMHFIYEKIAEVKSSFGLTLLAFDVSFPLAAQSDALLQNTVGNVLAAGACMLLTTLLFVPGARACFLLMWAVVSINAGVFALLALWDTRLDIISSITILLSIGYSVDFSSHVVYHYHFAQGDSFDRLSASFETMAWPVVQGSLSTLLGVTCVTPVHGYVAQTFVKTVFVVCAVGLYHCLLLLPVILIRSSLCGGRNYVRSDGVISAFETPQSARTAVVRPLPQEVDALRAVWVTCDGRLCDRCQPEADCHRPTCGKAVSLPDIRESMC